MRSAVVDGEAVAGGAVEGRLVPVGGDSLGEDAVLAIQQGQGFGAGGMQLSGVG